MTQKTTKKNSVKQFLLLGVMHVSSETKLTDKGRVIKEGEKTRDILKISDLEILDLDDIVLSALGGECALENDSIDSVVLKDVAADDLHDCRAALLKQFLADEKACYKDLLSAQRDSWFGRGDGGVKQARNQLRVAKSKVQKLADMSSDELKEWIENVENKLCFDYLFKMIGLISIPKRIYELSSGMDVDSDAEALAVFNSLLGELGNSGGDEKVFSVDDLNNMKALKRCDELFDEHGLKDMEDFKKFVKAKRKQYLRWLKRMRKNRMRDLEERRVHGERRRCESLLNYLKNNGGESSLKKEARLFTSLLKKYIDHDQFEQLFKMFLLECSNSGIVQFAYGRLSKKQQEIFLEKLSKICAPFIYRGSSDSKETVEKLVTAKNIESIQASLNNKKKDNQSVNDTSSDDTELFFRLLKKYIEVESDQNEGNEKLRRSVAYKSLQGVFRVNAYFEHPLFKSAYGRLNKKQKKAFEKVLDRGQKIALRDSLDVSSDKAGTKKNATTNAKKTKKGKKRVALN